LSTSTDILIVSTTGDRIMSDLVSRAVQDRGHKCHILETDLFPETVRLHLAQNPKCAGSFDLFLNETVVRLQDIAGVWYRRVAFPALEEMDPTYRDHSQQESHKTLQSVFAAMHRALWVDPVPRVLQGHHKVMQLEIAREVGLDIPDTLTTNDPVAARAFYDRHEGQIVTKMTHSFAVYEDGDERVVFTTPVEAADLEVLADIRLCPMIFQEKISKLVELRVTAIGDRLFVASIDASGSDIGKDDWRRDGHGLAGKFVEDEIPPELEKKLVEFMKRMGLIYGAIDIIRTPDGRHLFLEVNSAGEWGWIEMEVGHPIAQELAGVLTRQIPVSRPAPTIL
jgi:glutathione synthase/RimK-type ligase-like ATP-grasp enzyme